MRKLALLGLISSVIFLFWRNDAHAIVWDIHPGLYASYLFTDNYQGTPSDQRSDNIFAVGPSLSLDAYGQSFTWNFLGHAAHEFHDTFTADDQTVGSANTNFLVKGLKQNLNLAYSFNETFQRQILNQAPGNRISQYGNVTYNRSFEKGTFSLGYVRTQESVPFPDEDVESNGGQANISYLLTPRNRLDVSGLYQRYLYEIRSDVDVTQTGLRWLYATSPRFSIGPDLRYERHAPKGFTEQYVYTAMLSANYIFSQFTSLAIAGGESLLRQADLDNREVNNVNFSLRRDTNKDHFIANGNYGYRYEYTTYSVYGIYRTKGIDVSWEHSFLPVLTGSLGYGYSEQIPTSTNEESGEDFIYRAGLAYHYRIGYTPPAPEQNIPLGERMAPPAQLPPTYQEPTDRDREETRTPSEQPAAPEAETLPPTMYGWPVVEPHPTANAGTPSNRER